MTRPLVAGIDLSALRHNFQKVRQAASASRVMAVVKANAYGHGLDRVASALVDADGFGVASLEEAAQLRQAGIQQAVTLLEGLFEAEELAEIPRLRLDMVVHHESQIGLLERARLVTPVRVWLKVDSGMHRLGILPDDVASAYRRLLNCGSVGKVDLLSHLAYADDRRSGYTERQLDLFQNAARGLDCECSLANSGAILGWPDTHLDWVRPGLMLYGISPFIGSTAQDEGLQPVMTLGSRLIAVNRYRRQDAVGYGGAWVCPEDMDVGVVAVGYGDGYPRHAANGTPVLVNGVRAGVIGRVSMDMVTIDLRGHPDARVGDPVVLWGNGLPVEEVAQYAGTIAYELVCSVAPRSLRYEVRE
jgi:alanine racemase